MEIRDIIKWSIRHWYWFIVTLFVCLLLGGLHFVTTPQSFQVSTSLMVRSVDERNQSRQDEMMRLMGYGGEKRTADEIEILTSQRLLEHVVANLHLTTDCAHRQLGAWRMQYPRVDMTASLDSIHDDKLIIIHVQVREHHCRVRIGYGLFHHATYRVTSLQQPIATDLGHLTLTLANDSLQGKYRLRIWPQAVRAAVLKEQVAVTRLNKESQIIRLSAVSSCPRQMEDIMNEMIALYNQDASWDKNCVAMETAQFIEERLQVVNQDLMQASKALEDYKRHHQIANLDQTAIMYKTNSDQYEQHLAEIKTQIQIVDYVGQFIADPSNAFAVVPAGQELSDITLKDLISVYNRLLSDRNILIQNATESNPIIQDLDARIVAQRQSLRTGVANTRKTLMIRQSQIREQASQYASLLESVPEQQRTYLELERNCQIQENLYSYLCQMREQNALSLASQPVSVRIVDNAHMNPSSASPKLLKTLVLSIIIGLLLPLLFYALLWLKREYIDEVAA